MTHYPYKETQMTKQEYGQPFGIPPWPDSRNTASMVLGIVSLVIPIVGIFTAPVAIVLALAARKAGRGDGAGTAGLATATIAVCGYLSYAFIVAIS